MSENIPCKESSFLPRRLLPSGRRCTSSRFSWYSCFLVSVGTGNAIVHSGCSFSHSTPYVMMQAGMGPSWPRWDRSCRPRCPRTRHSFQGWMVRESTCSMTRYISLWSGCNPLMYDVILGFVCVWPSPPSFTNASSHGRLWYRTLQGVARSGSAGSCGASRAPPYDASMFSSATTPPCCKISVLP